MLHNTSDSLATRIINPNFVDYQAIRNWLACCDSGHSDSCRTIGRQTIPGFKVIDCETLQVIPVPQDSDFTYVTLSYVWGNSSKPAKILDQFPQTIQDAITVTSRIGYRYLWVDQIVRCSELYLVFLD